MITPILKDPKPHGGTLYTFPSASRDLTRAFTNSDYEFAFSHFACLNLPDFRYGKFSSGNLKGIYLDNFADLLSSNVNNQLNNCLKWHMQSYIMNYEVAILNNENYDNDILRTPSERIFFNWLQKVGAIKFSSDCETLDGYGDDVSVSYETLGSILELETKDRTKSYRIGNKLYTWKGGEWRERVLVSKTVQYIGTIDMINNVNIDADSFNEIYLNIPAGVGASGVRFFTGVFDDNYKRDNTINVKNDNYCDSEDEERKYIIGRNAEKMNSDDKTLYAIYDSQYNANKFDSPIYKINNGYCIDFNDSNVNYGGSIESMNLASEEDFEFNCVLIYYRIRKGNGDWCTNLYGVLFLEEVTISDYNTSSNTEDERMGYIQRYPKFKNGNSWGLKLDLKIDAQPDSQMELRDKSYDDPNDAVAMQMFTEALVHLNDCTRIFYEVKEENTEIEERLYKLENIVSGVDTVYDLRDEVGVLRSRIEMFQPTLNSLEGRVEVVETKISTLEKQLGYLMSGNATQKSTGTEGIYKKIVELEKDLKTLQSNLNSLQLYTTDFLNVIDE